MHCIEDILKSKLNGDSNKNVQLKKCQSTQTDVSDLMFTFAFLMHKLYPIVLLFVFLTFSCSQNLIILIYLSDIEGYTAKYCANIDIPKMECNGKCHLAEELAKDNQKQDTEQIQTFPTINLYIVSSALDTEEPLYEESETANSFYYNESLKSRNTVPLSPPPLT